MNGKAKFAVLALVFACMPLLAEPSFNAFVLQSIEKFPKGGGYNGSDKTKALLGNAAVAKANQLIIAPQKAQPSFCSGATYLVFLESLLQFLGAKGIIISEEVGRTLAPTGYEKDGQGIFGRWNSNGPGPAKLIRDLKAGENFTALASAQPGDFLKIWWTDKIGKSERGHHVVYLGHYQKGEETWLKFWSSNKPKGYGSKSIPLSSCKRLLFTRITKPERVLRATKLKSRDPWLEDMLKRDFTWKEVWKKAR